MKLPDNFQMRVSRIPGFTHTVTKNGYGDYEVNWARGYPDKIGSLPRKTFEECDVTQMVEYGAWVVVEDTPKQEEASLPDDFCVQHRDSGHKYVLKKKSYNVWNIYDPDGATEANPNYPYTSDQINKYLASRTWKIIDKKPLTPEQQRTLKEFKEQVQQLDSSIKLNEQDIEHRNRLIANYKARQDDLRKKIEEIES
jgi:hypothetical protein